MKWLGLVLFIVFTPGLGQAQVLGHSHNDYEQKRPLIQAIELGFISVEADVHETDGQLMVSHGKPGSKSPTLAGLYLRPLDSLIKVRGSVFGAGDTTSLLLMIDFKTDADRTYNTLKRELAAFPLLVCKPTSCPVRLFVSGNRPVEMLRKENFPVALDGRPGDLGGNFRNDQVPVISDHYRNWCSWNGTGEPDSAAFDKIRDLAKRVHAENKRLRLWAIPDHEKAWRLLIEAGVDLINTDRLEAFYRFREAYR